jgi:hypothetical protein
VTWRLGLTRGALLLMESLWTYAVVAFLVAVMVEGGRPSLPGTLAVVFASFGISRFLQNSSLSLGLVRFWGVLLSFIVFYLIVRADFFGDWRFWDFTWADRLFNHTEAATQDESTAVIGIPLLWFFWLRGVFRGQQHTNVDDVTNSFAIGVLLIAFVELLQGTVDTPAAVKAVAVPYVAVGLMAVALAHANRAQEEFGQSFTSGWLGFLGGGLAVLSLLALLFVLVDLGTMTAALQDGLIAATTTFLHAVSFLAWPFEQLINGLYDLLYWFFNSVWGGERAERDPAEAEPGSEQMEEEEREPRQLPGWIRLIIRTLVGGSVTTLLIIAMAILFTRFRKREGATEVRESTYVEGRLGADLGDMLGALIGRLRPSFHRTEQLDAARRLYFEMLNEGAQRGVERRKGETPLELSPRLEHAITPETPARITSVFDDTRYGGAAPPEEELRRLRREWESRGH